MNGLLFLLLLGVGAISLGVLALALTNRVIFKMAARNFARRKAQSAIVVAGLMIGTAIISSSLVVGDTMRYLFENETYHSLGEVDEEIYGISQAGSPVFFGEQVYTSVSENLSGVEGIQSVAPGIYIGGSVQDMRTQLPEPGASVLAFNSSIMRRAAFGDLNGNGYYADRLGEREVAINSRLADSIDAKVGDSLQLSLGVPNATNPLGTDQVKFNFTVAKIIREKDLYGKADLGETKGLYLELEVAQRLFQRQGQINVILISNSGDTWGGEGWTGKVNGTIRKVLDAAVGMNELGLTLERQGVELEMGSRTGYFSSAYLDVFNEKAAAAVARTISGTAVPTLSFNGTPTGGMPVIGINTTDPDLPSADEGFVYLFQGAADAFGIANDSAVQVSAMGIDGRTRTVSLTAVRLPPGVEAAFPPELANSTLGLVGPSTAETLLSGGTFQGGMDSFALAYGVDNATLDSIADSVRASLDLQITARDANLEVHDVKYDQLKSARDSGNSIGDIFMVFSVFSIIAGIVLIINIFVMLAEERKSEMGMARAVGMRQKHLVRMFLFEGTIYVFLSSAVGALLGLGFGKLLIIAFGFVFGSGAASFPFYFTWDSVLTAFCMGVLLTFVTIFFASQRSAKLNIIRAIRRIPEPRGTRAKSGDLMLGAALLTLGLLVWAWGASARLSLGWMAGPSVVALGLAIIAYKWVHIRIPISAASLFIMFWIFKPVGWSEAIQGKTTASSGGLDLFVVTGVLLVLAGVLLVMFNSDLLLKGLQRTVGRQRSTRAVLKTAVSYPMENKFKTGMTLAMFGLIIFTVTVIAMIASMQASTMENVRIRQSGGYDIIGFTNPGTPFVNLSKETMPASLSGKYDFRQVETLSTAYIDIIHYDATGGGSGGVGPAVTRAHNVNTLIGAGASFLAGNGFPLQSRGHNYSTDRQCWQALGGNDSLCIVDGSRLVGGATVTEGPSFGGGPAGAYVGGTVTITDLSGQNRTRTFNIIGIMYEQYFFQGIVVNKDLVRQEYAGADRLILVQLGPGQNTDAATKDFKRAYLDNGMQAIDIPALIALITTTVSQVMYLMEGFLAIGLLIGIAGIGIIAYRNVIERRQQIGMMRAIGYKRRNITTSFLIETSFITVIAILMGVTFGIGIGWKIFDGGGYRDMGASFVIPWGNLLVITIGAYIATLIFTFYPSIMAARIPPAEALRYIE